MGGYTINNHKKRKPYARPWRFVCLILSVLLCLALWPLGASAAEPGEKDNPFTDTTDTTNFPEFPAQGAVGVYKSARWLDENNDYAEITLTLNSVPRVEGTDIVLVLDQSKSMSQDLSACMVEAHYKKVSYTIQDLKYLVSEEFSSINRKNDDPSVGAPELDWEWVTSDITVTLELHIAENGAIGLLGYEITGFVTTMPTSGRPVAAYAGTDPASDVPGDTPKPEHLMPSGTPIGYPDSALVYPTEFMYNANDEFIDANGVPIIDQSVPYDKAAPRQIIYRVEGSNTSYQKVRYAVFNQLAFSHNIRDTWDLNNYGPALSHKVSPMKQILVDYLMRCVPRESSRVQWLHNWTISDKIFKGENGLEFALASVAESYFAKAPYEPELYTEACLFRYEAMLDAAEAFADSVFADTTVFGGSNMLSFPSDNRIALVSFNDMVIVYDHDGQQFFTADDRAAFDAALNGIEFDYDTNYVAALESAKDVVLGRTAEEQQRNTVVVFMSDGEHHMDSSGPTVADIPAASSALNSNVDAVYTIGYCMDTRATVSLQDMAKAPGVFYSVEGNETDLTDTFEAIATHVARGMRNAVITDTMGLQFELVPNTEKGWKFLLNGVEVPNPEDYVTVTGNTLTWNLGDVSQSASFTYYVKLKNGTPSGDNYPTNENASVLYQNHEDNWCEQTFPVPYLAYPGGTIQTIRYLTDSAGNPVTRLGTPLYAADKATILSSGYILQNEMVEHNNDIALPMNEYRGQNPSPLDVSGTSYQRTRHYVLDTTMNATNVSDSEWVIDLQSRSAAFTVMAGYSPNFSMKVSHQYGSDTPVALPAEAHQQGSSISAAPAPKDGYSFAGVNITARALDGTAMPHGLTLAADGTISGNMPFAHLTLEYVYALRTDIPYQVEHYVQQSGSTAYELDHTENLQGYLGQIVNATPRAYTTHTLNTGVSGTVLQGTVTTGSVLVLRLYYDWAVSPANVTLVHQYYGDGTLTNEIRQEAGAPGTPLFETGVPIDLSLYALPGYEGRNYNMRGTFTVNAVEIAPVAQDTPNDDGRMAGQDEAPFSTFEERDADESEPDKPDNSTLSTPEDSSVGNSQPENANSEETQPEAPAQSSTEGTSTQQLPETSPETSPLPETEQTSTAPLPEEGEEGVGAVPLQAAAHHAAGIATVASSHQATARASAQQGPTASRISLAPADVGVGTPVTFEAGYSYVITFQYEYFTPVNHLINYYRNYSAEDEVLAGQEQVTQGGTHQLLGALENRIDAGGKWEFVCWSLNRDGSGKSYTPPFVFLGVGSGLDLYAVWRWVPDSVVIVQPGDPGTPPVVVPPTPGRPGGGGTTTVVPTPTPPAEINRPTPTTVAPSAPAEPEESAPEVIANLDSPTVPLFGLTSKSVWSLFNLMLMLLGLLTSIIMAVRTIVQQSKKRNSNQEMDDDEQQEGRRWTAVRLIGRFAAILTGPVLLILFLLLEDITKPMALFDIWTPLMALVAIIEVAGLIIGRQIKTEGDEDDDPLYEG